MTLCSHTNTVSISNLTNINYRTLSASCDVSDSVYPPPDHDGSNPQPEPECFTGIMSLAFSTPQGGFNRFSTIHIHNIDPDVDNQPQLAMKQKKSYQVYYNYYTKKQ